MAKYGPTPRPLVERFWEKVKRGPGCWEWQGFRVPQGYGTIREAGGGSKKLRAHRVSYQLNVGDIPRGMDVLHKCDNPPCVRPDHLFTGTAKDNYEDCRRKGRTAHGEKNGRTYLTRRDVIAIRRDYANAPMSSGGKQKRKRTMRALALKYKATERTIRSIVSRSTWVHI